MGDDAPGSGASPTRFEKVWHGSTVDFDSPQAARRIIRRPGVRVEPGQGGIPMRNDAIRLVLVAGLGLLAVPPTASGQGDVPSQGEEIARLIRSFEGDGPEAKAAVAPLVRIGPPAIPALIEAIRSPNSGVRCRAAIALAEIKPGDRRALHSLVEHLREIGGEGGVRLNEGADLEEILALAGAFANQGPAAVEPLVKSLDHQAAAARTIAVHALAMLAGPYGPGGERMPITLSPPAIRRLIALADDPAVYTRLGALLALNSVTDGSPEADALIAMLVSKLDDVDVQVQMLAATSLVRFGPRAKAAVGRLANWFEKKEPNPWIAAEALGALGGAAAPAVPTLIRSAKDGNPEVREHALDALGRIGPVVPAVIPPIREAMSDPDARVRSAAAKSLARVGQGELPRLIGALKGPDVAARKTAIEALGQMGTGALAAVPEMVASMADPHEGVALQACHALANLGKPAVPALVQALKFADPRIRRGGAEALGVIGGLSPPHVEILTTLADRDPDPDVRRFAKLASAPFRPGDASLAALFAEALKDENEEADKRFRDLALIALGRLVETRRPEAMPVLIDVMARLVGPDGEANLPGVLSIESAITEKLGPESLPGLISGLERKEIHRHLSRIIAAKLDSKGVTDLIPMLKADSPARRAGVAAVFGSVGTETHGKSLARPAVPALTEALKDGDAGVRAEAATALQFIGSGDAEATRLLIRQMGDADRSAAERAGSALADGFRADPGVAVPGLIARLAVPVAADRYVPNALAAVGAPAVPDMIRVLREGKTAARRGAARAIGSFASKGTVEDRVALDLSLALATALADDDKAVRENSAYALRCLRAKARPAIPTLLVMVNDAKTTTRLAAIVALAPFVETESPALVRASKDRDPAVRAAAASALAGEPMEGEPGEEVIDPLLIALKDPDARVRASAATSLRRASDGLTHRATRLFVIAPEFDAPLFHHGELAHRAGVVLGLASQAVVGPHAIRMLQIAGAEGAYDRARPRIRDGLLAVLADPDAEVRRSAVESLKRVAHGDERALALLVQRLGDEDGRVRAEASEAVAGVGEAAVPSLMEVLAKDDAPRTRAAAAKALGSLNPSSAIRPALDLLVKAAADPDAELREQASLAFAAVWYQDPEAFRPYAARLVSPLLESLKHREVAPRRAASRALEWTGPAADRDRDVVPALITALDDPDSKVRMNSAVALRALAHRALNAVPSLHKACKDPERDVRVMARNAIDVILN